MKAKLIHFSTKDLKSKLFVILLSSIGVIRSIDWIITGSHRLKDVSELYIKLSSIVDINILGWLLLVASVILFASQFCNERIESWLVILGGLVCGTIHLLYGMVSVDSSNLATTYYNGLLIAVMQYLLVFTGVVNIWKTKN